MAYNKSMLRRIVCIALCLLALMACEPAVLPGTVAALTPTVQAAGPNVAELLRQRPAPGQSVEVDAFFSSGASIMSIPPPPDQVMCPLGVAFLADQSFPLSLYVLNSVRGNQPLVGTDWLAPTTPDALKPGVVDVPQLPYYARLRGHFGDAAIAKCQGADRIFVVEAIVTTYIAESPATPPPGAQRPADFANWLDYHNVDFAYRLPYPPGWSIEQLTASDPGVLSRCAIRAPDWPHYPIAVRVYDRETAYDPYDSAHLPPLMRGANGYGVFEQGLSFNETPDSFHLAGYEVEGPPSADTQTISVLFNGGGRTYDLSVTYPLGFDAPQPLLTAYTTIVEGFRLDTWPGPTATPPVKQTVGSGPFLSQAEALARLGGQFGADLDLLDARLISEAEARQGQSACSSFSGHPEAIWRLMVRGTFEGAVRTMRMFLDAGSGEQLCGEEIPLEYTPAPDHPGETDTPVPSATAQ